MRRVLLFIFCCLFFCSCKKDYSNLPYQKVNTPYNFTFRDIEIIDENSWIICGGDMNSTGLILRTSDAGINWTASTFEYGFDFPITSLYFLNKDTAFASDADLLIYKSTNGGSSWVPFWATSWPLTVNRNLRDIWFINDSTGFVCGGKNLGNGVLFRTDDGGDYWSFSEYEHEYRGICFADEKNGVMCGFGSLLLTNDGGSTFQHTDNTGAYFTGITLDKYNQYWISEFNGNILKSSDLGNSWQTLRKGSSWDMNKGQLNCIAVSHQGKIICAGPNGFITWSMDNGSSWNNRESFGGTDILKIKWLSENEVIAVGKNGGVYRAVL